MKHWTEQLVALRACGEAVEWARGFDTLEAAWKNCKRADHMLWLAAKTMPREAVVLAACDCAEWGVSRFVERGDHVLACLLTIHITREWAAGREDIETVRAARTAAAYAAESESATAAAAYATAATAAAATAAAYAAYVAESESATAAAAARSLALAEMADLVRARLPCPVLASAEAA